MRLKPTVFRSIICEKWIPMPVVQWGRAVLVTENIMSSPLSMGLSPSCSGADFKSKIPAIVSLGLSWGSPHAECTAPWADISCCSLHTLWWLCCSQLLVMSWFPRKWCVSDRSQAACYSCQLAGGWLCAYRYLLFNNWNWMYQGWQHVSSFKDRLLLEENGMFSCAQDKFFFPS